MSIVDEVLGQAAHAAALVAGALFLLPVVAWLERLAEPTASGRHGAAAAGRFTLAGAVKLLEKRASTAEGADGFLHVAAPVLAILPAMALLALVPLGPAATGAGLADAAASLHVALALPVLSTAAVALAGFAGNNRLALLGALRLAGLRTSALIALAMGALGASRSAGSLELDAMVSAQTRTHLVGFSSWGALVAPLGFVAALCALAVMSHQSAASRTDRDEDLVDPHAVEASGPVLLGHQVFERLEVLALSAFVATLFLGGYDLPGIDLVDPSSGLGSLTALVVITKALLVTVAVLCIRRALPPLDHSRAVRLCWTLLVPTAVLGFVAIDIAALLR